MVLESQLFIVPQTFKSMALSYRRLSLTSDLHPFLTIGDAEFDPGIPFYLVIWIHLPTKSINPASSKCTYRVLEACDNYIVTMLLYV